MSMTLQTTAPTPPTTSDRPLRVNPLLAVLVGSMIVLALLSMTRGAAANGPLEPVAAQSAIEDSIEIYIVQPGDTLWDIASDITPEGGSHATALDYLREQAGGAAIDVGQRIVIDHAAIDW